ncbi:MAG: GAF domain-containing protein [Bdellovibrionaceae bacterium]|nr:GAF domain-containing protein [Pseudobdellovibrionaceae bacterium]
MQTPASTILYADKQKFYRELASDLRGFLEKNWLMNLANFSALLNQHLPEINWVGFYLATGEELRLGPFQGLPACTRIPFGKGVCGTSAASKKIIVVDDVDQFPGHIVCDGNSKSEIVIPLCLQDRVLGVLDIDSPVPARFDDHDRQGLESLTKILIELTEWPAHF